MAIKLKSILGRIHWSLVLRAVIFSLAWFLLPFWIFLLIAAYFYFYPFFRPLTLALPFFLLVIFAAIENQSLPLAVFFAVVFYLILGIKDLILINRKPIYEILVLLLSFLMFVRFFAQFDGWAGAGAPLCGLAAAAVFVFLSRGFLRYETSLEEEAARGKHRGVALGLVGILLWQFSLAILFLPINFLYQAAILFLLATTGLEFASDYLSNRLTRQRTLTNFSVLLGVLVIILGSASWGL